MSPEDRDVLEQFAIRVRTIAPEARIWGFGSRARGDASEFSDLDVCIVLPERPRRQRRLAIHRAAADLGYERDRVITTVVFDRADFERGVASVSPLVRHVRDEGVAA